MTLIVFMPPRRVVKTSFVKKSKFFKDFFVKKIEQNGTFFCAGNRPFLTGFFFQRFSLRFPHFFTPTYFYPHIFFTPVLFTRNFFNPNFCLPHFFYTLIFLNTFFYEQFSPPLFLPHFFYPHF